MIARESLHWWRFTKGDTFCEYCENNEGLIGEIIRHGRKGIKLYNHWKRDGEDYPEEYKPPIRKPVPEEFIPTEPPADGEIYSPEFCLAWINSVIDEELQLDIEDMVEELCKSVTGVIREQAEYHAGIGDWKELKWIMFYEICNTYDTLADESLLRKVLSNGRRALKQ